MGAFAAIGRARMGRGGYAGAGLALAALKYNLDRFLVGGKPFFPWDYVTALPVDSGRSLEALAWTAVPFIIVGVFLTLARLRSVGWPLALVILFFLPVINIVFFAVLCWVPPIDRPPRVPRTGAQGWLRWLLPRNLLATAAAAVIISALVGTGLTALSVQGMRSYGMGIFFALPFGMALVAVLMASVHARCDYWVCVVLSLLTVAVSGALLVALAIEGVICLLMAAPLALVMAWLGATVGYFIQRQAWGRGQQGATICAVIAVMPPIFWMDQQTPPPLRSCVTEVRIAAPREAVWDRVVEFSRIPPPKEWVFQTGIAYPIEAVIEGRGVGAVRRCRFSTGDFVEPITRWEKPSRLAFSVESQPEPMREISIYRHVHPPHLDGYLVSRRGEFLLLAEPDGRTLLRGTTWYEQRLWPQAYWAPFTDFLLHSIHRRVLEHIRAESEAPALETTREAAWKQAPRGVENL